MKLLSVNQ